VNAALIVASVRRIAVKEEWSVVIFIESVGLRVWNGRVKTTAGDAQDDLFMNLWVE
jgi:hypothetical protein